MPPPGGKAEPGVSLNLFPASDHSIGLVREMHPLPLIAPAKWEGICLKTQWKINAESW